MRIHRLAPLALVLVTTAAHAAPLTVRVYDMTRDGTDRRAALDQAATALAGAGISVTWTAGPGNPGPQDLVLRLARRDAVRDRPGSLALGYAVVDTAGRRGTLATIFLERVEWLAGIAGTHADALLGLAIAHEIGHLLLGTNAHAHRGLMRAEWTTADLRARRPDDWRFTPRDGDRLRAGLAARLGTSPGGTAAVASLTGSVRH